MTQAREDLAARDAEIAELRSQLNELEAQQADSQRLIQMQNSRMKALQARLARQQGDAAETAPAADAATAPTPADASPDTAAADPWYLDPYVLGGGGVLLLGGLVFALRGRRRSEPVPVVSRRISEDDALKSTLPGVRAAAAEPVQPEAPAKVEVADGVDRELARLREAVDARPNDLEAHISLLRHYYAHGDTAAFESAAQAMRGHVRSTLDPRWREAVVMGVAMSPTNALFSQAGWNAPKFGDSGVMPAMPTPAAPAPTPAPATTAPAKTANGLPSFLGDEPPQAPEPEPVTVPEVVPVPDAPAQEPTIAAHDELEAELQAMDSSLTAGSLPPPDTDAFDRAFAGTDEDDGSATKIELARAYLDIGDVDGARGMLEEVLAEAGPRGRSEAAQLLKDIG